MEDLAAAWTCVGEHVAQGHSVEDAVADPGYPRCVEGGSPQRRENNVRAMYAQRV